MSKDYIQQIRYYNARLSALQTERNPWEDHWKEINQFILPLSGRFLPADKTGDKRHRIYDSRATHALEILAAGLRSGVSSPSSTWVRLTTKDPKLDERYAVKQWLAEVLRIMMGVFSSSNTYAILHELYKNIAAYGVGNAMMLQDTQSIIHGYPSPIGEFFLGVDAKNRVDSSYRKFEMTVGQVYETFGKDNCSNHVVSSYNSGSVDGRIEVVHAVEPRRDRNILKRDNKNMPWTSIYYEAASTDKYLRESGFEIFPVLAPRWDINGRDAYGTSPAMKVMPLVKNLQHNQRQKAEAIEKKVSPPTQAPTSLKSDGVKQHPRGKNYYDQNTPNGGIRTLYEVNLDIGAVSQDIYDCRAMINEAFFVDLFMMIASKRDVQMTATEVMRLQEEKMALLGPVLERIHGEILQPLIEMTFQYMIKRNMIPPPPPELQNRELNVEFVSTLAQAQKAASVNSVDRFVSSLGQVAQYKPEVVDKFNADVWADRYADMMGVDPDLVVPGEEVVLIRQQRAEQQEQMQQMEMMSQMAKSAGSMGVNVNDEVE